MVGLAEGGLRLVWDGKGKFVVGSSLRLVSSIWWV